MRLVTVCFSSHAVHLASVKRRASISTTPSPVQSGMNNNHFISDVREAVLVTLEDHAVDADATEHKQGLIYCNTRS